jgi:glycosyltransferase involved in cell wall biosynthesis
VSHKLKIVLLTTEFPPRIVGELSHVVDHIARSFSSEGFDVYVVTFDNWRSGFEIRGGVKVHYISNKVEPHINPFTWASSLSCEFVRELSNLIWDISDFDLIHAFEWSCALPLILLKESIQIPYVQSFLSLEELRSRSNLSLLGQTIKWIESVATNLADAVVAHSELTYSAIKALYPWCTNKLHLLDLRNNFIEVLKGIYDGVLNG